MQLMLVATAFSPALGSWFGDWFWESEGKLSPAGLSCVLVGIAAGVVLLMCYAKRSAAREYAAEEVRFRRLFASPEWRQIVGGRRIGRTEFFGECLRHAGYRCLLRPFFEREVADVKTWLFRHNHPTDRKTAPAGLAVCVIRRSEWRWPRVFLVNRVEELPGQRWFGQFTPDHFRKR